MIACAPQLSCSQLLCHFEELKGPDLKKFMKRIHQLAPIVRGKMGFFELTGRKKSLSFSMIGSIRLKRNREGVPPPPRPSSRPLHVSPPFQFFCVVPATPMRLSPQPKLRIAGLD